MSNIASKEQLPLQLDYDHGSNYIEADLDNIRETLPQLRPDQQEDVQRIEQRFRVGKGYLCTHGTGCGKAQPLDAKIMTPTGWKPMGSIKVGNQVIGAEGKPVNVIGVYPQGRKEIYKVTFSDGSSTKCCDEHLWETQTLYERRKASANPEWNCSKPKIRKLSLIRATLDQQHFIPIVKPIILKEVQVDIPPYVMGSLLGDGGFTNNTIVFTTNDPESVGKITSMLPGNMEMRLIEKSHRSPQYRIALIEDAPRNKNGTFGTHPWLDVLKMFGLHGLKSDKKFVPEVYLRGSIRQRTELLQGLMDTDGYCRKKAGSPEFTSVSIDLAEAVAYLARSLGGTAKISSKIPTYTYNGVKKKGLRAYRVSINLPTGIQPFSLKRKVELYKPNTKYPPRRKIVSIEEEGFQEAQCIAVDDPRHLYVTDDCILTHNTFIGLGVIKRFLIKGHTNILVVVPTDQKCQDWVKEGSVMDITICILSDTRDKGIGVTVTTYANFYQNKSLLRREWSLIVYDESHYLNQNLKGDDTVYVAQHKKLAKLPSTVKGPIVDSMPDPPSHKDFASYDMWREALAAWEFQILSLSHMEIDKTKVLFLSATPFAYHKSLVYADGALINIEEVLSTKDTSRGYNEASGFDKFLMEHLGYRMRYNKLTIPEVGVDQDLLERDLFETLKEQGVLSTRVLELDRDYSRHFIKVHNDLGSFIDEGISMWNRREITDKYKYLSEVVDKKYNYMYVSQLLECIKAQEVITRIRQHLALGRKVVIFHGFNNTVMAHPFKFDIHKDKLLTEDTKWMTQEILKEIQRWNEEFPEFLNLNLDHLKNVREEIKRHFPNALEFNGTINKKKRKENIEKFNNPKSGYNLIVIQEKAGREGISLHDKIGNRQRVLINLSLPVAPTGAIQTEGRIYRYGVNSDAIYEYITLHTNFEKIAFAEKIASRAKTAENLAMGNLARDLETSFKEGYINYETHEPYLGQGVGGKEADKRTSGMTEFDKAITYYYKRAKKNSRTKAAEGNDYFATPEPLGYKMVQWLNPQPEERGLEPSAGHGAISRYFPKFCDNTFVEPSIDLFSEMALVSSGRTECEEFEALNHVNKYDFVAMNPPFGTGGKLAMEHLHKAVVNHYPKWKQMDSLGFRLLAIIPDGASMNKRFEDFIESSSFANFHYTGEILLPGCTFERAGTGVLTRIVRIEHVSVRPQPQFDRIDLRHCQSITEFFDAIRDLEFSF